MSAVERWLRERGDGASNAAAVEGQGAARLCFGERDDEPADLADVRAQEGVRAGVSELVLHES